MSSGWWYHGDAWRSSTSWIIYWRHLYYLKIPSIRRFKDESNHPERSLIREPKLIFKCHQFVVSRWFREEWKPLCDRLYRTKRNRMKPKIPDPSPIIHNHIRPSPSQTITDLQSFLTIPVLSLTITNVPNRHQSSDRPLPPTAPHNSNPLQPSFTIPNRCL